MLKYYAVVCCYLRRRLASGEGIVLLGVHLSRCHAVRRISLGEGNVMYPLLSSYLRRRLMSGEQDARIASTVLMLYQPCGLYI